MKTFKLLFLLLITLLIISCNSKEEQHYANVAEMVNSKQLGIEKIAVNDLKTRLDHPANSVIIDCRESDEYIAGHIPGAISIPRGILEFSSKISNRREAIYIYSETNDRASLAYTNLKLLKYKTVFLIDLGWEEWIKTYPDLIETGSALPAGKTPAKKEESSGCGG